MPADDRPPTRLRVLVVDDQPVIRRGIALMLGLEPDLEVVGQAADGIEALALARAHRPDVALMDLQMPRMDGVAAIRLLADELPAVRVVVLTTFDTDELVFDAIRAGAQAYLLKDASESEVLETIHAVARGEPRLAPGIARKVIEEFRRSAASPRHGAAATAPGGSSSGAVGNADIASRDTGPECDSPAEDAAGARNGDPDALTRREESILALIADGLDNKTIARTVFLAEGTVKNYVSRIMDKLHARSRTELAVKALRQRGRNRR